VSISSALKSAIKRLPIIKELAFKYANLRQRYQETTLEHSKLQQEYEKAIPGSGSLTQQYQKGEFVPPGHFYSAIPSLEEVDRDKSKIFGNIPRIIPAVELHESRQLELLKSFIDYYQSMPFTPHKTEGLRYYFENPAYSYSDAIFLHCMLRHVKPKKIIEIGSGFSSCVTLDTDELFLGGSLEVTFIEPYPDLLRSLIKAEDNNKIKIIPKRLQDVELCEFEALKENDVLFIDSTHVSKINSDVNRIFFEILPILSPGVYIHFHDVFFPFEYPMSWVYEGRAWNEIYMLRAFLQNNSKFKVVLMNTFMEHFYKPFFQEKMPLCLKNPGGSIWIRKE
jgi:predicted O-methyltransferase YrrM